MKTKTIIITLIAGIVLSLTGAIVSVIELTRLDYIPFNDNDTKVTTTLKLDKDINTFHIDTLNIRSLYWVIDNTLDDEVTIEYLPINQKHPLEFSIKDNVLSCNNIMDTAFDLYDLKTVWDYFMQGLQEKKVYDISNIDAVHIKINQKWYDIYQRTIFEETQRDEAQREKEERLEMERYERQERLEMERAKMEHELAMERAEAERKMSKERSENAHHQSETY